MFTYTVDVFLVGPLRIWKITPRQKAGCQSSENTTKLHKKGKKGSFNNGTLQNQFHFVIFFFLNNMFFLTFFVFGPKIFVT